MSPKRNRQAADPVEWDPVAAPTGPVRPARRPVRRALSSTLAAMVALFLLAVGASAFYALTMTEEYTGRSLVQFRPGTTSNGGVVSNETAASSAAGYAAYLGVPSTLRTVSSQIAVPMTELRDGMTVQLIPATTSLSITFEDRDPLVAARAATALAQVAAERATDDPLVSATVLAPASVPDLPSSPSKKVVLGAGVVLGLLLAAVAYVVSTGRRRRQPTALAAPAPSGPAPTAAPATPAPAATSAPERPAGSRPAAPSAHEGRDDASGSEAADVADVADEPTRPVLTSR